MVQVLHRWAVRVNPEDDFPLGYETFRSDLLHIVSHEGLLVFESSDAAVAWAERHMPGVQMVAARVNVVEERAGVYRKVS